MPERKKWDHPIDLKPDFVPKDSHIYPMNPEERQELREFLDKDLRKGYIRPSTSPQDALAMHKACVPRVSLNLIISYIVPNIRVIRDKIR